MASISDTSGKYESDTLNPSMDELLGLARGLMADQKLSDSEIMFLSEWLDKRSSVKSSFPGSVIYERTKKVLEDGIITEEERNHLVGTLSLLTAGRLEELADEVEVNEFWFDQAESIDFHNTRFSLTGNFVYGPRKACKAAIEDRGGIVSPVKGHQPQFLVVGGLGVDEWRAGGLGEEINEALRLRGKGVPLKIISEDQWVSQL